MSEWFAPTRRLAWVAVTTEKAVELSGRNIPVRLGERGEQAEWAWVCCCECGQNLTDGTRGRWSPFFCAACDVKRMDHLSRQFAALAT
jgi:hypothetical protein